MQIDATYSPEDNKIRLYASERLDSHMFDKFRELGFHWAPKQKLFVCPSWTPAREDLALEVAGEIFAESSTIAERAADKAARLEDIAGRRAEQSSGYERAAAAIAERFEGGQPILIGHHSERKARKDAEKIDAHNQKAAQAHDAVGYWLYRATAVERHANAKNSPRVRAGRIDTLLASLRKYQATTNEYARRVGILDRPMTDALIHHIVAHSNIAPMGLFLRLKAETVTPAEAHAQMLAAAKAGLASVSRRRWIAHTLNRLSYERELLGPIDRFTGPMTAAVIQVFVRTHGADKPKAVKVGDVWTLQCQAPLPVHIGESDYIELTGQEWRDLMFSVGYEVPAKRPAKPPILNLDLVGEKISCVNPWNKRETLALEVVAMTKAEYGGIPTDYRGTRLSICGEFRVKMCRNPHKRAAGYAVGWVAAFISDSKIHDTPETIALAGPEVAA